MSIQDWKNDLIGQTKRQILQTNNMTLKEADELAFVLSNYLDEGIIILRNWRKLKDDTEFVSGKHDSGLIVFIKSKYQVNGRDLFNEYTSGGIKSNMKQTPESLLKASCKQVM